MATSRAARRRAGPVTAAAEQRPPSRPFQICLTALLLAVYVGLLAHPIDLTSSDLGRHLKNGELFFASGFVAHTNLYAYSHADHPFVNHHWGSGAVFYLIERNFGFTGLSVFFLALSALTLWFFFDLAVRYGSFALATVLAITMLPVLITRHEIRPELFSYFFSGLFLHLLWDCREGRWDGRWLFALPFFQLLWVNLHIYFFLGLLLIGAFLLEALIGLAAKNRTEPGLGRRRCNLLALVLFAAAGASCVNPAGYNGAVYPLLIFRGYEFPVIENYSVPAIVAAGFRFLPLRFFLIAFGALAASWFYVWIKDRARFSLCNLVLAIFFSALAWSTIRNFALFAFFALPLTAVNLAGLARGRPTRWLQSPMGVATSSTAVAVLLMLIEPNYFFAGGRGAFGIGAKPGNVAALEFMRQENLRGPIFNSYDTGGYLIYALYPRERVYVDNRPEAYPAVFFAENYFPLLVNEEKWRAGASANGFDAIVINPGGRSAAAENFTVRRLLDADWAAVFYDKNILILARRHGANQAIIAKHELPREKMLRRTD
jgi:hypothetical protein